MNLLDDVLAVVLLGVAILFASSIDRQLPAGTTDETRTSIRAALALVVLLVYLSGRLAS